MTRLRGAGRFRVERTAEERRAGERDIEALRMGDIARGDRNAETLRGMEERRPGDTGSVELGTGDRDTEGQRRGGVTE